MEEGKESKQENRAVGLSGSSPQKSKRQNTGLHRLPTIAEDETGVQESESEISARHHLALKRFVYASVYM